MLECLTCDTPRQELSASPLSRSCVRAGVSQCSLRTLAGDGASEELEMDSDLDRVVITRNMHGGGIWGLVHMQVCVEADATDEEILAACNSKNPAGTTMGWADVIREDTEHAQGAVACEDHPERLHLLVGC